MIVIKKGGVLRMRLLKSNLAKLYVLSLCLRNKCTSEELKVSLKENSIEDMIPDVLYKTIKALEQDKYISITDGVIDVTYKGVVFFNNSKKNLNDFIVFLNDDIVINANEKPVPICINDIVAFKTVPFRVDVLNNSSATDFFKGKINKKEAYVFEGRKLGRSLFYDNSEQNKYNYAGYCILFINSGLIEFVGFVDSYSQEKGELLLSKIIRLLSPITVSEIRNNVRSDFNISQQKQEFFKDNEVAKFKRLLVNKIRQYGCETYENEGF